VTTRTPNEEQSHYWNGPEAAHWLDHEARYEAMLSPFTVHLLRAGAVECTDRVLDVGCGCGSSTRAAARLAAQGHALGVDLSHELLSRARYRARQEGLVNVSFEHADAQVHAFASPRFDVAISRFGVMFFEEPTVAFSNLARSIRPGGRLAVVCWAGALDNEWVVVPGAAAAEHVPLSDLDDPGGPGHEVKPRPGPFSLADSDQLSLILVRAGFVRIETRPLSVPLLLGSDITDTVEFLKSTGMGQTLLKGTSAQTIALVTETISAALEPYLTGRGVELGSKSWLVTAHRPE
jgi:SAM-dependent methyltransferase